MSNEILVCYAICMKIYFSDTCILSLKKHAHTVFLKYRVTDF